MTTPASRYDYRFDPSGDSTAAQVCRMVGHNKNVLELGCAAGAMSAVLAGHYQCRVTGVEYDPTAAESARAYCQEVLVASLDTPDWPTPLNGRTFDTVVAADVLEHLHAPENCLAEVGKLLEENGRLVVSVPSIAHSGVLAQLMLGEFEYTDIGLLDRTHVHFFTRQSLGRMLHATGFKVIETATVDTGPWHPEFSESWQRLPVPVHDWLAGNPAGRAYQVLMLAQRCDNPGAWSEPDTAQQGWLESFPSTAETDPEALVRISREADELRQQCHALQLQLKQMQQSQSWRLTAPLRKIARLLK